MCHVDVDACNEETSSAWSSDSDDDQSVRGSKRKQETTDGQFLLLPVCLSVTRVDQSKTVEVRTMQFSNNSILQ